MRFRVEILLFSVIFLFQPLTAQIPTNVFEIESILVDACGGSVEGKNEMVLIMTGPNAVNFSNVRVDGAGGSGTFVNGKWPNTSNSFLGWAGYNAALRAKLDTINGTIVNCGKLLEPPSNIVPAGKKCLIITSHEFDATAHDFSTLTDTLYVVCQNNTSTTSGNFANYSTPSGNRYLRLTYTTTGQTDQVSYDKVLLINQLGVNAAEDGAGVRYTWAGSATYYNDACTAPYEPLVPDFTLPATICPNSSALDLNTTITGTTGGTWSGTGVTGHMFNPSGLSGSISITYTVGIVPCDSSQTNNINVSSPTANAGSDASITCTSNVGGVAIGSATVAGNTYAWSPSTGLSSSTVSNPTANPTATTTYTVTVTNTASGCTATDQVTVTVNVTSPTANAGADTSITCTSNVGGVAIGSDTVAGNTYAWSPSTGLSSSTVSNPTSNPSATTTYTVTVTNTANGCTATDQVTVTVNALPNVSAGVDASICPGENTTLTATGASSFIWDNSAGNTASVTVTPSATTTYIVEGTDANGCKNTDDVTVVVKPIPNVNAGSDLEICIGLNATLTANNPDTANVSWNQSISDGLAFTPPLGSSTYIVTADLNGCINKDTVEILTHSLPLANAGADQSICFGQSTHIDAGGSSGFGSISYNWNNGLGNGQSHQITPSVSCDYIVTATDGHSCNQTDTLHVELYKLPTIQWTSPSEICFGDTFVIDASASAGYSALEYTWGDANQNDSLIVFPSNTTSYYLTITDEHMCSIHDTVEVIVNKLPTFDTPTIISVSNCGVPNGSITVGGLGGTPAYEYNIDGGSYSSQNQFTNLNSIVYQLGIKDSKGCKAYSLFKIEIPLCIPSVITPNADGVNDTWEILGIQSFDKIEIHIFNRWGDQVYSYSGSGMGYADQSVNWDGTWNGLELALGTYVYILDTKGQDKTYQGLVTIVR